MKYEILFKKILLTLIVLIAYSDFTSYAEGSKQLMPDTSSRAALCTQSVSDDFAAYYSDANNRLYIHIKDAVNEVVYLNFSLGYGSGAADVLGTGSAGTNYYFRIKDPAGNIVFGPKLVNNNPIPAGPTGYSQVTKGPSTIYPGGYSPYTFTPTSGNGDYYIEFNKTDSATPRPDQCSFDYWDITVANVTTNTAIDGRIWAWDWGFYTRDYASVGSYSGKFKGKLYDYSYNGIVESIDFSNSGLRGGSFRIGLSSTGPGNTGNIIEDRKSVAFQRLVGEDYKMFLNNPDSTVYPTGSLSADAFTMSATPVNCNSTSVTFHFNTSHEGVVEMLLDFNDNGLYDPGTRDRIMAESDQAGSDSLIWDLKDGLGNDVSGTTDSAIKIIVTYGQSASHLTLADVEYFTGGFVPVVVRPLPPTPYTPKLYYDDAAMRAAIGDINRKYPDTTLSFTDAAQPAATQLNGCIAPCHTWTNFGTVAAGDYQNNAIAGYGNQNSVNTWWYSYSEKQTFTLNLPSCNIPLPVQLISWTAAAQADYSTQLDWVIANNASIDQFEIQRSFDLKSYNTIAIIKNNIKTDAPTIRYAHKDRDMLLQGKPYAGYRMVLVSRDGKRNSSKTLIAKFGNNGQSGLIVHPNPVTGNALISFNSNTEGAAVVRIFDLKGRLIHSEPYTVTKGKNTIGHNFNELSSGVYQIDVIMNGVTIGTKRIRK